MITWTGTTLGGVLGGKSSKTSGEQHSAGGPLEWIVILAPVRVYSRAGSPALAGGWSGAAG